MHGAAVAAEVKSLCLGFGLGHGDIVAENNAADRDVFGEHGRMHIVLEFNLTPEDLYNYRKVYPELSKGIDIGPPMRKPKYLLLGWAAILAIAIAIFVVFHREPTTGGATAAPNVPDEGGWLRYWPWAVPFTAALAYFFWQNGNRARVHREFSRNQSLSKAQRLELTDEAMIARSLTGMASIAWSNFVRFGESQELFLLFRDWKSAHVIPKRVFASQADVDLLRGYLQARVGNKPIGFPVIIGSPGTKEAEPMKTECRKDFT
jgi:hypothetical protein